MRLGRLPAGAFWRTSWRTSSSKPGLARPSCGARPTSTPASTLISCASWSREATGVPSMHFTRNTRPWILVGSPNTPAAPARAQTRLPRMSLRKGWCEGVFLQSRRRDRAFSPKPICKARWRRISGKIVPRPGSGAARPAPSCRISSWREGLSARLARTSRPGETVHRPVGERRWSRVRSEFQFPAGHGRNDTGAHARSRGAAYCRPTRRSDRQDPS
jgi:hypothetical protein